MLGIDTNILIRYITQDDPIQSPLVSQFLKQECTDKNPCYLSNIVLCEMVWVLETAYHYQREQVAAILQIILEISGFIVEESARNLVCIRGLSYTRYGFFGCLIRRNESVTWL